MCPTSCPIPTSPFLLTITQSSPFPPGQVAVTVCTLGVDIFFESPQTWTQAREPQFRQAESSGSRLEEAEVQIQGWALHWLRGPGQVA